MSVSSRWHDAEAMLAREASWVTSPRWPTVFIGLVLAVLLKRSGWFAIAADPSIDR
jgi:ABC-type tungstate transport system substrate-binding protein